MTTVCATCGMPLEKKEDVGLVNGSESFCKYCVNTDGTVKNGDQIFEGGVSFFMNTVPWDIKRIGGAAYQKKYEILALLEGQK